LYVLLLFYFHAFSFFLRKSIFARTLPSFGFANKKHAREIQRPRRPTHADSANVDVTLKNIEQFSVSEVNRERNNNKKPTIKERRSWPQRLLACWRWLMLQQWGRLC
jgi:hypothetical protein